MAGGPAAIDRGRLFLFSLLFENMVGFISNGIALERSPAIPILCDSAFWPYPYWWLSYPYLFLVVS